LCFNLHRAVWVKLDLNSCFHDFIELFIGHKSCNKKLWCPNVVQCEWLNFWNVNSHFSMDSWALNTHYYAKVGWYPSWIWGRKPMLNLYWKIVLLKSKPFVELQSQHFSFPGKARIAETTEFCNSMKHYQVHFSSILKLFS